MQRPEPETSGGLRPTVEQGCCLSSVLRGCLEVAQQPSLVLAPLPVSLPLGFSGFLLSLPGLGLLGGFLARGTLPLLRLTLGLLVLVAGYGARGFLHPALGLLLHRRSFLAVASARGRSCFRPASALVGRTGHVLDGDAPLGACALYLRDIHPKLLGLLLGGLRSVGLLLLGLLLLLAAGLLGLLGDPTHSVLRTLGFLACLIGYLAGGLLGLLECLVYRIRHPEVLGRLVERFL